VSVSLSFFSLKLVEYYEIIMFTNSTCKM